MKNTFLIFGLLFGLATGYVNAQDSTQVSPMFTLDECVQYALEHQVAVKNAYLDVEIADAKVKETIGRGLPQVNATLQFQDFVKLPTQLLPGEFFGDTTGKKIPVRFGTQFTLNYGLEATQLLFDGSYLVGLQASQVYKELSTKSLKRSKIETAVAVSKAYYSVLVVNEKLKLVEANIQRLKTQLNDTKALFENGFAEKIDADRLQVLFNNTEVEKENLVRMAYLNKQLLKFQMGMEVNDELTLEEKVSDIDFEPVSFLGEKVDPLNRIEYSLMQTQIDLNKLDVKRYKSTMLPQISAFGNYSKNGQDDNFGNLFDGTAQYFPTAVIGLRVTIPLIGGGQKWQQIRQAKLALRKSQNEMDNLRNSISLEAHQATTNYINSVASMENQQRNMELAKEVHRVTQIKYNQGVGSNLEVVTAETALKEAETNYVNALYEALISKIDLQKAKGTIDIN